MDTDGELVCIKPFPSQPTHFWNDEDGIKYTKAYFSMFKGQSLLLAGSHLYDGLYVGVWAHGDFCSISSETGGIMMLGRRFVSLSPSLSIVV